MKNDKTLNYKTVKNYCDCTNKKDYLCLSKILKIWAKMGMEVTKPKGAKRFTKTIDERL